MSVLCERDGLLMETRTSDISFSSDVEDHSQHVTTPQNPQHIHTLTLDDIPHGCTDQQPQTTHTPCHSSHDLVVTADDPHTQDQRRKKKPMVQFVDKPISKLRKIIWIDVRKLFRVVDQWEGCEGRGRKWIMNRKFEELVAKYIGKNNWDSVYFLKIVKFGFWDMHNGTASDANFRAILKEMTEIKNRIKNFDLLQAMLYTAASQMVLKQGNPEKAKDYNKKAEMLLSDCSTR